ncbi:hypothetical protein BGZ61DRAFT_585254 [Ilyonectria robusta]|uniref:uncharacterized protein n=1 Tax=Ilyonectria robusta TaxID=1079257 RepID=UPI001E8EF3BA|nr:uncharacterized protein BGZ61DRAFT_585254 [Ilyonectria robusta]KAH8733405.1 hypothetical protein BGZ61DRAFT_585254 [Ilyonectria robusta]
MFELPEAKRVRRADLDASDDAAGSDDEGYDAELQAKLNAQIARSLGLDESYAQPRDFAATPSHLTRHGLDAHESESEPESEAEAEDDEDAGNEEFAFRLFNSTRPSQKVVLEEDLGPQGDGGFAFPRPLFHYMATNLTADQKQQYVFAAVSGDEVLARSKDRAWGLELPWKVTNIAVTRKRRPGESTCTAEQVTEKKKGKPGKKQRISLRKRAKAREETERVEAQKLLEKEEHSKDKKKRMNRLKKLRKRAKNKEMKAAANKDGEAGAEDSGDESAGSD